VSRSNFQGLIMKRTFFFSCSILFAAAACAVMGSIATFARDYVPKRVQSVVASVGSFLKTLVLDGFKLAVPDAGGKDAAVVAFVQAKAFVVRLAKRERPLVTDNWRMCPSI
jgi:hypothetical protein